MRTVVRRVGNTNHIYTYNGNRLVGFQAVRYYNQRKVGLESCSVACSRYSPDKATYDSCMQVCNGYVSCINTCNPTLTNFSSCLTRCKQQYNYSSYYPSSE